MNAFQTWSRDKREQEALADTNIVRFQGGYAAWQFLKDQCIREEFPGTTFGAIGGQYGMPFYINERVEPGYIEGLNSKLVVIKRYKVCEA